MCGRTACTLEPGNICCACTYQAPGGTKTKYTVPDWVDHPGNYKYYPSHNVAPTSFTPVLVSSKLLQSKGQTAVECTETTDRVIQPMMWGLVPVYHKGPDPKTHGLSTNNCRVEGLLKSPLYKKSLNEGQRCVILCDGFYEWQRSKNTKLPYFIYAPQADKIKVEDPTTWPDDMWNENSGWSGPRLMAMAGLFSVWRPEEGDTIFSYTIITMESNDTLSWLHHRMPAILDSDKAIADWIDSDRIDAKSAYAMLNPVQALVWHPVSTLVNNARNKDSSCNNRVDHEEKPKPQQSASSKFMSNWLKRTPKKSEDEVPPKKPKLN